MHCEFHIANVEFVWPAFYAVILYLLTDGSSSWDSLISIFNSSLGMVAFLSELSACILDNASVMYNSFSGILFLSLK